MVCNCRLVVLFICPQYSDEVLTAFSSHKLDDLMMRRRDHSQMENLSNNFFAKYLTSEKVGLLTHVCG